MGRFGLGRLFVSAIFWLGCLGFGVDSGLPGAEERRGTTLTKQLSDLSLMLVFTIELRVHTITKKHYIPESTFIYQKALRKHMQGGICMPCGLLFYVCWIIMMYTCGKKRYTILKRD